MTLLSPRAAAPLGGAPPAAVPPAAAAPVDVQLPVLEAGGFHASVDAYAGELDPAAGGGRFRLWFLSLLGAQQAVKAIWARLVKGELAVLSQGLGDLRFCALAPEPPRSWRFLTAGLPAAAGYHGMLVPDTAYYGSERPEFLLLLRPEHEAAALHFRFLNRRLVLPLHPDWSPWLWERALAHTEAVKLESSGLTAYRCLPNPDALAADLTAAIRSRSPALPLPLSSARAGISTASGGAGVSMA